MLYYILYSLHEYHSFFNVFRYITLRTIYAILTALILSLVIGPYMIEFLKRYQIGQVVRDNGPRSHLSQSGTPTMGGLLIIMVILFATLSWMDLSNLYIWLVLLALIGFGLIGFTDDYLKVVRKKSAGVARTDKFTLQVIVASLVG